MKLISKWIKIFNNYGSKNNLFKLFFIGNSSSKWLTQINGLNMKQGELYIYQIYFIVRLRQELAVLIK